MSKNSYSPQYEIAIRVWCNHCDKHVDSYDVGYIPHGVNLRRVFSAHCHGHHDKKCFNSYYLKPDQRIYTSSFFTAKNTFRPRVT